MKRFKSVMAFLILPPVRVQWTKLDVKFLAAMRIKQ